jgi:hypothetical protein
MYVNAAMKIIRNSTPGIRSAGVFQSRAFAHDSKSWKANVGELAAERCAIDRVADTVEPRVSPNAAGAQGLGFLRRSAAASHSSDGRSATSTQGGPFARHQMLLDAAFAVEPPAPTETAPSRRRRFRLIQGGKIN